MVRRKIDRLYFALQEKRVFTTEELREIAQDVLGRAYSTQHLNSVYLGPLEEEGLLRRPRRGLYVVRAPNESSKPNPYLIASKLRSLYYLGYNTALEVEGAAYSSLSTKFVVVRAEDKFEPFEFDGVGYRPVITKNLHEGTDQDGGGAVPDGPSKPRVPGVKTVRHAGQPVRVSTPARSFIDCVDRPELAGGWEYCLKSLDRLKGVEPEELRNLLLSYGNQALLRKVGYVLELLVESSPYYGDFGGDVLEILSRSVGDYKIYLDRTAESELQERWKLYVPVNFEDQLEGV